MPNPPPKKNSTSLHKKKKFKPCGACVKGGHVTAAWQWSFWLPGKKQSKDLASHILPILPVRVGKPFPCHLLSSCKLNNSWVSAVAIETKVKAKIPPLTLKTDRQTDRQHASEIS